MDPRWERIRVSLLQHVESAEAGQEFAELSATLHALSGCARARDAISCAQQDKDNAEETSRSLIHVWHERFPLRQTVGAFLMLCLWRRLTSLFYNQRSFWIEMEEELSAEIMRAFLNAVNDRATEQAQRVSETLVLRNHGRGLYLREGRVRALLPFSR